MVKAGMAWHAFQFAYEQSGSEREAYRAAEERARGLHLGLWAQPGPMVPWQCRASRRAGQKCR
jgi:endonuclease YncB( thermonuclease family)